MPGLLVGRLNWCPGILPSVYAACASADYLFWRGIKLLRSPGSKVRAGQFVSRDIWRRLLKGSLVIYMGVGLSFHHVLSARPQSAQIISRLSCGMMMLIVASLIVEPWLPTSRH